MKEAKRGNRNVLVCEYLSRKTMKEILPTIYTIVDNKEPIYFKNLKVFLDEQNVDYVQNSRIEEVEEDHFSYIRQYTYEYKQLIIINKNEK